MEIKFKEVNSEYKLVEELNKRLDALCGDLCNLKIKPYFTLSELKSIVDSSLEEKDMITRQMIIVSMITDYCTNLDIIDENGKIPCEDVYNLCAKYNLFTYYYLISNYNSIEELIKDSESTYKIAEMFNEQIGEMFNKFDMNNVKQEIINFQDVLISNEKINK